MKNTASKKISNCEIENTNIINDVIETTENSAEADTSTYLKTKLSISLEELRERFLFVIELWAADRHRYAWLEARTGIPGARWQNVLLEKQLPTLEMLIVVCDAMPQYTFWLMDGTRNQRLLSDEKGHLSVIYPPEEQLNEFRAHRKWVRQKKDRKAALKPDKTST